VNVLAADTDEEAHHLATSLYAFFLNVIRGTSFPLNAPVEKLDDIWNEGEKNAVQQMLQYCFVGSGKTVKDQMQNFVDNTGVDELMVVSNIFNPAVRLRSYEMIAQDKKHEIETGSLVR
jgi:alkanesulfonate monooxygenase SsuD/methylene tetrahydromethanopterin reductase-like flavin-dependent oxidoreductase (luciferase family)